MKLGLLNKSRSRIVEAPTPGVWIGAQRRLVGPTHKVVETEYGDSVESIPPQYLFVLWKPYKRDEPFLRRYPAVAELASVEEAGLPDLMLKRVPEADRLCVMRLDVDWALVAQIVMIIDSQLGSSQHQLLKDFIEAEQRNTLATIGSSYRHEGRGFERFVDTEPHKLAPEPE